MSRVPLKLSVLDQSPISEGMSGGDALRNTIDLAQLADSLGYARYWLAEHHATPMLACASPEALIGPVAAATRRLKVGSGGVMLPHYSPLKVAETFSTLSGLFPGRIDLGVGRAPGTDDTASFALQRDRRQRAPYDFPQQLAELLAYLWNRLPPDHPFARLAVLPGGPEVPEPWLLGSSEDSSAWAAELGLPYMFADFINPHGVDFAARYRESFVPSGQLPAPRLGVAASVVCAETDAEALRLAASMKMVRTLLHEGRLLPIPPVDKALAFFAERGRDLTRASPGRREIVGAPATVRARIEDLAEAYGAEEVMIVTITYAHAARRRSYELIAQEFALPGIGLNGSPGSAG